MPLRQSSTLFKGTEILPESELTWKFQHCGTGVIILYDFSDFGLNDSSELISKMIAQLYLKMNSTIIYIVWQHIQQKELLEKLLQKFFD